MSTTTTDLRWHLIRAAGALRKAECRLRELGRADVALELGDAVIDALAVAETRPTKKVLAETASRLRQARTLLFRAGDVQAAQAASSAAMVAGGRVDA